MLWQLLFALFATFHCRLKLIGLKRKRIDPLIPSSREPHRYLLDSWKHGLSLPLQETIDIILGFLKLTQIKIGNCNVFEAGELSKIVIKMPGRLQLALKSLKRLLPIIQIQQAMTNLLKSVHRRFDILAHLGSVSKLLKVLICFIVFLPDHESVSKNIINFHNKLIFNFKQCKICNTYHILN